MNVTVQSRPLVVEVFCVVPICIKLSNSIFTSTTTPPALPPTHQTRLVFLYQTDVETLFLNHRFFICWVTGSQDTGFIPGQIYSTGLRDVRFRFVDLPLSPFLQNNQPHPNEADKRQNYTEKYRSSVESFFSRVARHRFLHISRQQMLLCPTELRCRIQVC